MNNKQSGFSIIELMVVIVIIGVLAGMIVPNVLGRVDKSKVAATRTSLTTVANALDEYKIDNGQYPTALEGLSTNTGNAKNFPDGGYLKLKKSQKVPVDAWDRDLQYSSDGKNYSLFSFGSDGAAGGEGNDADIDSAE